MTAELNGTVSVILHYQKQDEKHVGFEVYMTNSGILRIQESPNIIKGDNDGSIAMAENRVLDGDMTSHPNMVRIPESLT